MLGIPIRRPLARPSRLTFRRVIVRPPRRLEGYAMGDHGSGSELTHLRSCEGSLAATVPTSLLGHYRRAAHYGAWRDFLFSPAPPTAPFLVAMDQIQDQLDPEVAQEVISALNRKVANLRSENAELQVRSYAAESSLRSMKRSEPNRANCSNLP